MNRYSQMSKEELHQTLRQLERDEQAALDAGLDNKVAVVRQKMLLAKSHLIDPKSIQTKRYYAVQDTTQRFFISYLKGVIAWGYWEHSSDELTTLPLGQIELDG